jgi:hypothetical protein
MTKSDSDAAACIAFGKGIAKTAEEIALAFHGEPDDKLAVVLAAMRATLSPGLAELFATDFASDILDRFEKSVHAARAEIAALPSGTA